MILSCLNEKLDSWMCPVCLAPSVMMIGQGLGTCPCLKPALLIRGWQDEGLDGS